MKVLLFGASGNIGSAIADELLSRGHTVTGVTRTGELRGGDREGLTVAAGDVTDAATVAELAPGHDAVASAVGPRLGVDDDRKILVGATQALIEGLRRGDVTRLVVLGGAGSLEVSPGVRVIDNPNFPAMWKANALAQSEALGLYREVDDLDWTFISPAALIEPGERTGTYRRGGDQLLVDADGKSRITIPDYAVAFVDELERGEAVKQRITVAY
ncbi:NAD(P)-dependent oxidoreductase [Streptomyces sp. NPDC047928]|uniref:NAD(P)-dependent oxidoreductase n=1 Tax=unclassified Streptomyces TaxID=2593676 RepID=UPI0037179E75